MSKHHILYVLALVSIGYAGYLSVSALSVKGARAARDLRTHSEGNAGWARLSQGMAHLHLLFFAHFKRRRLRNTWTTGLKLGWGEWLLCWLGFSAITLIINQAFRFDK